MLIINLYLDNRHKLKHLKMGLFDVNESFSNKIQEAILSVCMENYSQGIEVDGLVCISFRNPSSNCVVKIHKYVNTLNEESEDPNRNNSNWSHDSYNHRTASDDDGTGMNDKNEEQMYFYEENLEIDNDDRCHFSSQEGLVNNRKGNQYNFGSDVENVECNQATRNMHGYSPDRADQSGNFHLQGVVKVEQSHTFDDDDNHELSRISQPTANVKKNNLETIIERFSNQNNPVASESNEKDTAENIFQYKQNSDLNYNEGNTEATGKQYGSSVCIDLSESDPDLFEVQSEIEARLREEINRKNNTTSRKCWPGPTQCTPSTADLNSFSSGQPFHREPLYDTSLNSNKHSNVMKHSFKSLTHSRKMLKVPLRRQLPQGANIPMVNSNLTSVEPKKVYCKFCGVGFTNSGNKNRHERSTCGAVKYKCDFCESLFSRSDSRARHMLYCHGLTIKDRPTNVTPKKNVLICPDKKSTTTSIQSSSGTLPNFNSFSDTGDIGVQPKVEGLENHNIDHIDSTVTMETNSDLSHSQEEHTST